LLFFGQTLFFILFFEIGTKNAAAFEFGSLRFCRDDIPLLSVADDLGLVGAAGKRGEVS
jgi:hypothetical protein